MKSILRKITNKILFSNLNVRHREVSAILSADDEPFQPTERLINLAINSIQQAKHINFIPLQTKTNGDHFLHVWPGEHYKLLAGIVKVLQPNLIIEIGTARGLSALAMNEFMPKDCHLVTFDIIRWQDYMPSSFFQPSVFENNRITQYCDDLSQKSGFNKHSDLLRNADLIFIDAAKDGKQERRFIELFSKLDFRTKPIFVFDDIRVINMLAIWRELNRPKLDLTSFGHWSGTGLVDWVS